MPKPAPKSESHQTFPAHTTSDPAVTLAFAIEAARTLSDEKCEDIVVLDVRDLSQVTDYILIGTGTSDRQMHSALTHVEHLGRDKGYPVFRSTDDDRATWLLADFVDVVVHVFEPNQRAHYDLEMLWGDATRVDWKRTEAPKRSRPGVKSANRKDRTAPAEGA